MIFLTTASYAYYYAIRSVAASYYLCSSNGLEYWVGCGCARAHYPTYPLLADHTGVREYVWCSALLLDGV